MQLTVTIDGTRRELEYRLTDTGAVVLYNGDDPPPVFSSFGEMVAALEAGGATVEDET